MLAILSRLHFLVYFLQAYKYVVAHQKRQMYGMVFFAAPETPKPIILYPISYLEGDHLASRTNLFLNLFNRVWQKNPVKNP